MVLLLRYGAYPSILLACVIGNLVLFHMGTGVLPATYLPVSYTHLDVYKRQKAETAEIYGYS